MSTAAGYTVYPLGDRALVIDYGNRIDEQVNRKVLQIFNQFCLKPIPGIVEAVPAYSSVTFYYDVNALRREGTAYAKSRKMLEAWIGSIVWEESEPGRFLRVPVCYDPEFGKDLRKIADEKKISVEDFIREHGSVRYRVYMLGFLPGFAYMGTVSERLSAPRKSRPVRVRAGSVGIAGRQTGIYPFDSPGGWQIIGRCPLELFDATREEPAWFRPGDRVEFYAVGREEYQALLEKKQNPPS